MSSTSLRYHSMRQIIKSFFVCLCMYTYILSVDTPTVTFFNQTSRNLARAFGVRKGRTANLDWGRNLKMPSPILTPKNKIYCRDRQFPAKYLRMKSLKPMIKDVEPNKYVLEAVKSCDLATPLRVNGHVTYFFKFGTPLVNF